MRKKKNKIICTLFGICISLGFVYFYTKPRDIHEDRVFLGNYKNIEIPVDLLSVSEEDISASMNIRFSANNPYRTKANNSNIVEYGDVVVAELVDTESGNQEIVITVEQDDENQISSKLVNLTIGDGCVITIENKDYELTIKDIGQTVLEMTDEYAKEYFNCDTVADFREFVKTDIYRHRIFEYCYDELLKNAKIQDSESDNSERKLFLNKMFSYYGYPIPCDPCKMDSQSLTDFEDYSMLLTELNSFFDEFIILRELARQEDFEISDEELNHYTNLYVGHGYDADDLHNYLSEYVLFDIYYDYSSELLLNYNLPQERSI